MIKGSDTKLLKKFNDNFSGNRSYKRPNRFNSEEFIVCHYAGEVEYEVKQFIEKNKDTVSDLINETLSSSGQELVKYLYKPEQGS